MYGDCVPERDFPTIIDLHLQGRLPLEKFVTERIPRQQYRRRFHSSAFRCRTSIRSDAVSQLATVHLLGNMGVERVVTSGGFELDDRFLNIDTDVWIIEAMGDIAQQGRALTGTVITAPVSVLRQAKERSRLICGKSRP